MKKVLLNATLVLTFSASALAQTGANNFPQAQAKKQKHQTNSSAVSQSFMNSRAEGDIIWSDDFSTASNWAFANTSTPPHGWSISTNLSAAPVAAFAPVNFPTGANGYAFVNSDEAGTQANPSATNATIRWNGTPIDCSAFANVSLKFNTATRNWASTYFFQYSTDGGTTWSEIPVLQHITTNVNTANSEVITVNVSQLLAGQSQVMVGFRYQADWGWFWSIDDIQLFETWNYDLNMTDAISSLGAAEFKYTIYPVSQVVSGLKMGFGADVQNIGAMAMSPALKVTQGAWNATSAQTTSNPQSATNDTLSIAAVDGYTIPNTVGTYNFTLDLVTSQTVQNPALVTKSMPFSISELVMAKDDYNGNVASLNGGFFGWASATGDPGIGTEFELNNAAEIGRVQVGIANVATANQADYLGRELFVELWRIVNDEPVFAGISEPHIVASGNFGNLVNCTFETPVSFAAGEIVIAIAASTENAEVPVAFSGKHLAGGTIGKAGSGFVTLAADGDYVDVPVVRLDFGDYTGIDQNTLISQDVKIYPNPAADNANVQYTLTEEANVNITVCDLSGKVVYSTESGVLGSGSYTSTIDVNNLAQGLYTVTLTANGAQVTQKLMKK